MLAGSAPSYEGCSLGEVIVLSCREDPVGVRGSVFTHRAQQGFIGF